MLKSIVVAAGVSLFSLVGLASGQQRLDSLYQPQVFKKMPVRVMKPLGFDAKQTYPVIVSLHGSGGKGTNNKKQLKDWNRQLAEKQRRTDFPCYVVAPQSDGLWDDEDLEKIQTLIKTLPAVDIDRIYVMGHSMGGHGTYIFIQLAPDYFAAAAPSAGSGRKQTRDFIDASKIKHIPIWAFHGDKDSVCPIEKDQSVLRDMKELGGNMKLTTWVGDNHAVSGKMIVGAENGTTELSSDQCSKETDFMKWMFAQSRSGKRSVSGAESKATKGLLKSGEYFITQSWSQEQNFKRSYHVNVPKNSKLKKLPVLIFLHGNGGDAARAMKGFRRRSKIMSQYITVFAQGYGKSWNIVSERSKADDLGFIEAIVKELAAFENVEENDFSIFGSSNGAAMVNQIAIESKLPNIQNYISGVSQLNVWQYDGKNFKAKGKDNNYQAVAKPIKGKRLMNISGVEDKLVPYRGGLSKGIRAKDGKLGFVDAEESTFLWARQMGYRGEQLTKPTKIKENVEIFSYLDGDVVHCKVKNEGHGATHGISEEILLKFLQKQSPSSDKDQ